MEIHILKNLDKNIKGYIDPNKAIDQAKKNNLERDFRKNDFYFVEILEVEE